MCVCQEVREKTTEQRKKDASFLPSFLPLPLSKWVPRSTSGGRESSVDIISKPVTRVSGVGMQTKTPKIRVYSYVHKVRVWEGLPGNRVCVCKCHVCMCAYTAYVAQLKCADQDHPSATCHWVSCPVDTN